MMQPLQRVCSHCRFLLTNHAQAAPLTIGTEPQSIHSRSEALGASHRCWDLPQYKRGLLEHHWSDMATQNGRSL